MDRPSIDESKRYIAATPVLGDAFKIPGLDTDAYVIGQDLYVVAPSVPNDLEHRIAQCLNYAYNSAEGQAPNADLTTWYAKYFDALQNTGLWIPLGREGWITITDSHEGITVQQAILKIVGALLGNARVTLQLVTDSLTALTSDASSQWFTLFDRASKGINVPSCQITVVTGGGGQPVTLDVLAFALEVTHVDAQLLFFRFSADNETFKYRRHTQMIDDQGLQRINALAPAVADRIGSLGPTLTT